MRVSSFFKGRFVLAGLLSLLLAMAAGTVVYAIVIDPVDPGELIHACFDSGGKRAGKIRVVPEGTQCKSSETPLSWRAINSFNDLDGLPCMANSQLGWVDLTFNGSGEATFVCETGGGAGGSCGDGMVGPGEQCDDGNLSTGDGCTSSCAVETGWECIGNPSVCSAECGDGTLAGSEVCDDGNTVSESSCEYGVPSCQTCNDSCTEILHRTGNVCGDGDLYPAFEQCDDGNTASGDGCSAQCEGE